MKILKKLALNIISFVAALLLSSGLPITVFAETADTTQNGQNQTPYTYNSETGKWDTDKWYYDESSGTYKPKPQPVVVESPDQNKLSEPTVIDPTTIDSKTDGNANVDVNNQSTLNNNLTQDATSGDAKVTENTTVGDATSGNATDVATVVNKVNSQLTLAPNQKAVSFTKDVLGDVNGDIVLQPLLLKAMLEGTINNTTNTTANISDKTTNAITNNLNLSALSGNADVTKNTTAGNATSGSANTVANVVNILNSMIGANKSFIGTINIYGNLNGDILIAPDFISQLLASNGGTINQNTNVSADVNSKNTDSIINNVSLAAESGKAAVTDNTTAGNATTGSANTNLVIFNLTGHEIIAANSLLVFVNVLGKWVGVIVDAPGATAAAIGNGVINNTVNADLKVVADNNAAITNNLNLNSRSGNVTVANNTNAGNATSGNATASANVTNISQSKLDLSGWFGILFINVFGTWNGSFGVDTPSGNPLLFNDKSAESKDALKPILFVPHSANQPHEPTKATVISNEGGPDYRAMITNPMSISENTPVAENNAPKPNKVENSKETNENPLGTNMAIFAGSTFAAGLSYSGIKRMAIKKK